MNVCCAVFDGNIKMINISFNFTYTCSFYYNNISYISYLEIRSTHRDCK